MGEGMSGEDLSIDAGDPASQDKEDVLMKGEAGVMDCGPNYRLAPALIERLEAILGRLGITGAVGGVLELVPSSRRRASRSRARSRSSR